MWGTNPAGKTLKKNKYRFNTKFRAVGTSLGKMRWRFVRVGY